MGSRRLAWRTATGLAAAGLLASLLGCSSPRGDLSAPTMASAIAPAQPKRSKEDLSTAKSLASSNHFRGGSALRQNRSFQTLSAICRSVMPNGIYFGSQPIKGCPIDMQRDGWPYAVAAQTVGNRFAMGGVADMSLKQMFLRDQVDTYLVLVVQSFRQKSLVN